MRIPSFLFRDSLFNIRYSIESHSQRFAPMNTNSNTVAPVLFEDEWLVAFDKPSGLLVAPDRWDKERANLMQRVHERLSPEFMNVHRLDRETSGVLLCAKNLEVGRDLIAQFEQHQVKKIYWAI